MANANQDGFSFIDEKIRQNYGKTGVFIMEKGEEALLARA